MKNKLKLTFLSLIMFFGLLVPNIQLNAFGCDTSGTWWYCNYSTNGEGTTVKKCEKKRASGNDGTYRCAGNSGDDSGVGGPA